MGWIGYLLLESYDVFCWLILLGYWLVDMFGYEIVEWNLGWFVVGC